MAFGQNLGDFHWGFRVYRREVLETMPFERNSDDFVFDSQFLVQAVHFGFRLGDIPVPVRYFKEASSINFTRSCRYGVLALRPSVSGTATNSVGDRLCSRNGRFLIAGADRRTRGWGDGS